MNQQEYDLGNVSHFHWGTSMFDVPNYPKHCIDIALSRTQNGRKKRVLDIGCMLGRGSFELARVFDEVVGIDAHTPYVREALRLKESGKLRYMLPIEGDYRSFFEISLRSFGLEHASKKVNFWQYGAHNYRERFGEFDMVVGLNVLERTTHPTLFLEAAASCLRPNGHLVLASAYTPTVCKTTHHIGYWDEKGEYVFALQAIQTNVSDKLVPVWTEDVAYIFPHTARRYEHNIAQLSIWEKR